MPRINTDNEPARIREGGPDAPGAELGRKAGNAPPHGEPGSQRTSSLGTRGGAPANRAPSAPPHGEAKRTSKTDK